MNPLRSLKTLAYLVALMLSLITSSLAVCVQTGASTADQSLWNTHGCWQTYFLWQYRAYDLRSSDWAGRGWNDACNVNLEFPKHWNAAYLVTYGLTDNLSHQFHGTIDYRKTAEAASSDFHQSIYHAPTDAPGIFGSYDPNTGRVSTACPLYNPASANANPGSRAGDFMHEGWHAWLKKYNYSNGTYGGHRAAQGNCTAANFCDYFYFHGIGAYAFGAMYQQNGTASRFHSPNQVQVEFLCDVADDGKNWVSTSVRQAAQADANQRASQRFINGPGYYCGSPRPW
ncbi:hypothetical protein [Deinococcus sp.]|uniref:hypothetical protein n=1 Tax=Deinococcus sp. TaxID=47478 RepID=UPI002869E875|nr:hypothetical protein [Deinococcus sp.]